MRWFFKKIRPLLGKSVPGLKFLARQFTQIFKENKIWVILFFSALILGLAFFSFWFFKISPKNLLEKVLVSVSFKGEKSDEIKPKPETSPYSEIYQRAIDGAAVDSEEKINPPLFAVMIENIFEARPLSGISKASLVYEAITEAGITRFLAIYTADNFVEEIGPVRSARLYYLDWAEEYGALYAHCGGSPEAIRAVSRYNVFDLDQFYNGQYFWRSKKRFAPHNLYTSTELLNKAFNYKGWEVKDFEGRIFKEESKIEERPVEEREIVINFSTPSYKVNWKYDLEKNDYLRYQAGEVQRDKDGSEVRAKNIIVQFVKMWVVDSVGRKRMETIGNGRAIVFRDGKSIEGKWVKIEKGSRTAFYDENGEEIKFNPGITWIEVVPIEKEVEFK